MVLIALPSLSLGDGLEPLIGTGHPASFGALDYGTV